MSVTSTVRRQGRAGLVTLAALTCVLLAGAGAGAAQAKLAGSGGPDTPVHAGSVSQRWV